MPRLGAGIAGAVVAGALALASPSAGADDDVARRLDQLEALVESQQAQIEALTKRLAEVQAAPPAPELMMTSSEPKVKVSLFGQVNRAVLYYDDGAAADVRSVDTDAASTRIGLQGSVKATDDLRMGSVIEVQFESNSTGDISQFDNSSIIANNSFTERKLEVFADSKSFGRLSLGQGSLATDGLTEIDLSGTGVVSRASAVADGGGLGFVVAGAETPLDVDGDAVPDVRVNRVFRNLSGGRDDRVRYDTPTFHGFQLSSSYIDGGKWDLAIGYAGELADLKVAARIGYTNQSGTNAFPEEIIGGSLSVLHASGLNAGIALGRGDDEDTGRAQGLWFGKLGYQTKLLAAGTSAFALDYGRYDDFLAGGDEAATFGVQVVQRVSDWGTDFYAGYRNYRLDRPGTSFNSIDTVLSGARVRS